MNLTADLIAAVADAARYSPRSRQVSIGPSEIGVTCSRRLAAKSVNLTPTWTDADPWAAIIGTAVHSWLATAFMAANNVLDEPRWLVEQRVHPNPGTPGNCDLYDLHEDAVIDHKILGTKTLREIKNFGPSEQYRVQGHLYGLGWERLGRSPKEVVLACWPRGGYLSELYLHREPYDRNIAVRALDRLTDISAVALSLDLEGQRGRLALVPASPGEDCKYCPYKSIVPGDGGCTDAPEVEVIVAKGRVPSLKL